MANTRKEGPAWGKLATILAVTAALAAAWRYTPLSELVTAERIVAWARAVREVPWAPAALVLAYTPGALIMFPRPLLTLFGIVAFGPWLGFTYSMAGIVISALVTYYAGRAMPKKTVRRVAGEKLEHMSKKLRDHSLLTMTAIRLVPAAPFGVEGVVAGAVRVKVWPYTLGTVLGMAPGVLAMTVFGSQISAALEDLSSVNYWMVAAALLLVAALTFGVSRWALRQTSTER